MSDTTLMLDPRLDFKAAGGLAEAILGHVGKDLTLDATQVTHMGAMGVQVLRAAALSWAESGHQLNLVNTSTDCVDQLDLLGFTPDSITKWEEDQ